MMGPLTVSSFLFSFAMVMELSNSECVPISHLTNTVLMVPPTKSTAVWDPETSADNSFMNRIDIDFETLYTEWSGVVDALRSNGITVMVAKHDELSRSLNTPNCLFPNNWFSTHDDTLTIYPMKAPNRRLEVRADIIQTLNYPVVHDMTPYLDDDLFLEGTGVLVLDRQHKIAYMSISERASPQLAAQWARRFKYELVLFESVVDVDTIYHTNVMMSVGSSYVIICMECIKGNRMRQAIRDVIEHDCNKEVIEISQFQVTQFCGNVLELGSGNERLLVMSDSAYNHFSDEQKMKLTQEHGLKLVASPVNNIETLLGGGVRCMIAELFTPSNCATTDNAM